MLLRNERALFPDLSPPVRVMIFILPNSTSTRTQAYFEPARYGYSGECVAEQTKLKRQLAVSSIQRISYALIVGPDEIMRNAYTLKDLANGEQQILDEAALTTTLQEHALETI